MKGMIQMSLGVINIKILWVRHTLQHTRCIQKKMSQVLQVLDIFEIWISRSYEFSGHQKWSSLAASVIKYPNILLLRILHPSPTTHCSPSPASPIRHCLLNKNTPRRLFDRSCYTPTNPFRKYYDPNIITVGIVF